MDVEEIPQPGPETSGFLIVCHGGWGNFWDTWSVFIWLAILATGPTKRDALPPVACIAPKRGIPWPATVGHGDGVLAAVDEGNALAIRRDGKQRQRARQGPRVGGHGHRACVLASGRVAQEKPGGRGHRRGGRRQRGEEDGPVRQHGQTLGAGAGGGRQLCSRYEAPYSSASCATDLPASCCQMPSCQPRCRQALDKSGTMPGWDFSTQSRNAVEFQ